MIASFLTAPSAERVSKHGPVPCGHAVNQRLKDGEQKEEKSSQKGKEKWPGFESIRVETGRINRACLHALVLLIPVGLYSSDETHRNKRQNQSKED